MPSSIVANRHHRSIRAALLGTLGLLGALAGCTRTIDLGENLGDASTSGTSTAPPPGGDAAIPVSDAATESGTPGTDGGARDAATAGPAYAFLTRAVYDANMGGLAGADSRCQASARAAGLDGTYRAWLSDPTTDAKDRIQGDGPWLERGTSAVLFPTHASLTGFPERPLLRDEYGDPAEDRWWTGTSANGIKHTKTCIGWTSNGQLEGGMTGTRKGTGRPGKEWTEDTAYSCVTSDLQKYALLCFGPM